ncbi:S-layer homology domain-containing protein [Bacillus sp. FJAT-28004]|uniref:S-layer homology domain-containing protein n=1 Tax=Bacillus sp. FJAT-28004 TaxID=1679165 RepID=UPI0006B68FF8|nr:S-layer homology domain-containing protein [Bacillus sp. FJAT-28004]
MLKKQLSFLIVLSMLITTLLGSGVSVQASSMTEGRIQAQFFVSPTGNDTNNGSYDHPFATMQAARDAVRLINEEMTGDIYVFIASGNYYVNEPITFNESDSGTNGFDVIYRNLDELGSAQFIGGNKVTSAWESVTRTDADADLPAVAAGNVYKTNVGTEVDFNTLYVNDARATMARTKNKKVDPRFPASSTEYMRSAGGGISSLVYKAADLDAESLAGLVNAQTRGELDAQVYMWDGGYWDWMTDTIPVAGINTSSHTLTYKTVPGEPHKYRPKYATGTNARYFLQGNLGFLDQPGEYYYNKKTGYLYYYPLADSGNIEDQNIVIPAVEKIIDIKGESRTSMVSHITFSGLTFKDTNFPDYYAYGWNWGDAGVGLGYYPPEAANSTQPSYAEQSERVEFQVGVITLSNTNNITISKTHIKNAGMFGIELYLANQHTMIEDSLIEHTGHGGVNIEGGYPGTGGDDNGDGYSRDNTVTNSIIHDIGQLVGQTAGVTINNSGYNTLSHLEIYNTPRRGIFITGGYNRNPNVDFPNGDKNYNIMTDLYAHHNNFSYIYLHDSQQDGGDDGAFFSMNLYRGSGQSKPNYINQMIIDNVGSNPSMTDFAPNGINLDVGASGFELSNLKVVNPQNFNVELNTIYQYGDSIKLTNTNIDYGSLVSQIGTFDDTLMEYDLIGVTKNFPSAYLRASHIVSEPDDIYFKEDFENGIEFSKWSYKGTVPVITTEWMSEGVLDGKQGLKVDSNKATGAKPVLYRSFTDDLNKIVTVKMFDRQNNNLASYDSGVQNSSRVKSLARADDGTHILGLGIDAVVDSNYYVMSNDGAVTSTAVPRTYGWHELKWDYTSGSDVKLYIDDVLVSTTTTLTSFNNVSIGSEDGFGISYYDQLYIYGGEDAADPGSISTPTAPAYDSSNDNVIRLDESFEDGVTPDFAPNNRSTMSVIADSNDPDNKILENVNADGSNFYETGASWNNYIFNLKWKFGGWGTENVLGQAYDNFTIYVMTAVINGTTAKNPAAYQVIYRRNKNGTNGFPAGTPYFEVNKHTSSSDISLGKSAVPEGFVATDWHDLQIQTYGGKVGFVVDGSTLLTVDDGTYTYGGVGFGGINSTVYMDDFKITSNPTYVNYGTNFNLGNATISGDFNPTWYQYEASINDDSQPITLVRPEPILAGSSTKVELNGNDITDQFTDYTTAIELPNLKYGRNTLVLSEITSAGTKTYTIHIEKTYKISSIETIDSLTTELGTAPSLPVTIDVTFEDESIKTLGIKWDHVKPAQYKQTGMFTVSGQLVGINETVSATVNVVGLESISELEDVITTVGTAPTLAETISAQFTDGPQDLTLTFVEFDPAMYANAGTIIAVANVEDYPGNVLQKVIVQSAPSTSDDLTAPNWPANTTATATKITTNGLTLSWTAAIDAVDVTQYKVTWDGGNKNVTVNGAANSVDISELNAGTKYSFKIEAGDAAGNWSTNGPVVSVETNSGGNGGDPSTGTPGDGGNTPDPGDTNGNGGEPSTGIVLTDVSGHWARASIEEAIKLGFIAGYTDGTFRPNAQTTRSEFAAMLSRALKLEGEGKKLTFADLEKIPAWAIPFIARTTAAGILQGYGDQTFQPDRNITRAEMAVMIARALELKVDPNAKTSFADANTIPAWAKIYVAAANEAGIIKGRGNNRFAPNENATRAEAVTMVLAMLNNK